LSKILPGCRLRLKTIPQLGLGLAILLLSISALTGEEKPAGKSPLDRFSSEEQKNLLAGKPIYRFQKSADAEGKYSGYGQCWAIINSPIDTCFKIFLEFEKQYQYYPRKTKSEVVNRKPNQVWLLNVFDFYLAEISYTVLYTIDPNRYRIEFQLDQNYPHNLNDTSGFFWFEKMDDQKTLFTYAAVKVDTGLKVPSFIQQYLTSRDLPAVAENVKKRIESGGKWTK